MQARTRRAVPMMPTRWVLASDEDICLCRKACSSCSKCRWLPVLAPSLPLAHTTSSQKSSNTCTVDAQRHYHSMHLKAGTCVRVWGSDDLYGTKSTTCRL